MTGTLLLSKSLDSRISALPGVERKKSRWGNRTAYFVRGKEIAHFHSNHEIDIRLTRHRQRDLSEGLHGDGRVKFRQRPSEWIAVTFSTNQDARFALALVEQALKANS